MLFNKIDASCKTGLLFCASNEKNLTNYVKDDDYEVS